MKTKHRYFFEHDMAMVERGIRMLPGLSIEGLHTALDIKACYEQGDVVCLPEDEGKQLLLPEHLLNRHLDLNTIDDPLSLAMLSSCDPEASMAIAAGTRLSPVGRTHTTLGGIVRMVGETTRHELVRDCIGLITESAFDPDTIDKVRHHANNFIASTRKKYSAALRQSLRDLLDGKCSPRQFIKDFFLLTEHGNLHNDIRKRLVLSLLLSDNVRPGVKFLMLENCYRMPKAIRAAILADVLQAPSSVQNDLLKEEVHWIVAQEKRLMEAEKTTHAPSVASGLVH